MSSYAGDAEASAPTERLREVPSPAREKLPCTGESPRGTLSEITVTRCVYGSRYKMLPTPDKQITRFTNTPSKSNGSSKLYRKKTHFNGESHEKKLCKHCSDITLGDRVTCERCCLEQRRELVATITYDFVAGGKARPAGTYTVSRSSDDQLRVLSITSYDHRVGVFVLTNMFESSAVNDVKVTVDHIGDVHLLRSIETRNGVYTFALPRATTPIIATKRHGGMSASGTP